MVKKAARAVPNQLLRRARLERGWIQKMVAERIGAPNDVMVTRWESGAAFPSPYYVERLCQLFEQRASDLGLIRDASPQAVSPASQPLAGGARRSRSFDEQPTAKASPASSPFSHLPLVGREADTRTLQALHQAVEQGRTQAVLLQGEAGVGKTHLASTFLRWVASQGTTVLQGRAFEMGGRLPYRPLVHALGRHLEEEPVLERAARWLDWTYALGYLGSALAARGHVAAGVAQGQRTVERARRAHEMKNGRGVMARHFLSIIHLFSGDYLQMLEENDQVVKEAQQLQDWLLVYWGYGFRSWAEGRLGRHEEAMESMTRAQTASQRLGGQIMGQDILEAVTAELLLADVPDESALYQVEEALARAEATIALSREEVGGILGEGLAQRVWGQALARLERWEEAERHLAESWQILLSGENLLEAARTQVAWGLLCRDRGEVASARGHFEQAAAQFETSGLTREVESVWSYLAQMGQS